MMVKSLVPSRIGIVTSCFAYRVLTSDASFASCARPGPRIAPSAKAHSKTAGITRRTDATDMVASLIEDRRTASRSQYPHLPTEVVILPFERELEPEPLRVRPPGGQVCGRDVPVSYTH